MVEIPKVLVLDDDPTILQAFEYALEKYDVEIVFSQSIVEAVRIFRKNPQSFAAVFVDHRLKQADGAVELGLGIVPHLKNLNKDISPVMISANETEVVLRSWLDQKINRYLYKPLNAELVRAIFEVEYDKWEQNHIEKRNRSNAGSRLLKEFNIVGQSEALIKAVSMADKAAQSSGDLVTLVLGDSGTGKELIAQGIHRRSSRGSKPFLPVNCAAFGENSNLLDSELFGHEKGAFTGADKRKIGIFEAANGGTVFLDEVQTLSSKSCERLLRFIQERKFRRVGGNVEYPVDVKIVAAAKPDLLELAKNGKFLPDLYYRLNGLDIELPSLVDRIDDIPVLAHYFLEKRNSASKKRTFDPSVMGVLKKYNWPGNVRELESAVKRAFEVSDSEAIQVSDLPKRVTQFGQVILTEDIVPLDILKAEYTEKLRGMIIKVLERTDYNATVSSKLLGVKRSELRSKMRSLGIQDMVQDNREKLMQA